MAAFPWQLVTFDIDGTLTRGHGWRPIAEEFGELAVLERTNRRFLAREVGEEEHLADLLDIATGHTVAEVQAVVARTPKLSGIAEGVRSLKAAGAKVALLTHNPPYVTEYYLRTFGFDAAEGVDAQAIEHGRIGPPHDVRADKREGLARLLERFAADAHRSVHLGDGWADVPVFRSVGAGVALNTQLPEVRDAADLALVTEEFGTVVAALHGLRPRR